MPEAATDFATDAMQPVRNGQLDVRMLRLRNVLLRLPPEVRTPDRFLSQIAGGLDQIQRRKLSALLNLYMRENSRYLNFYGPPGTIRTIHIADVISVREALAASDPLLLRDRAVFVGYSDNREWDIEEKFATVYSDGLTKMSGVELLATAFANLLDGSDLRRASLWARVPIAFLAGSVTALFCYAVSTSDATLFLVLATGAYLGFSMFSLSRLNI
jgi:adenylate cyclase